MATRNYKSMTEEELRSLAHDNTVNWHNYDNQTAEGRAAQEQLHKDNVDIYAELDSRTGGKHTYDPKGTWSETPGTKYSSDYPQIVQRLTDEARNVSSAPAPTYQSNFSDTIAPIQEEIRGLMGQSAPAYSSQYANDIQAAAQAILSRDPFSYDPQTDPLYSQYRKQYTREGQRAAADVLGQYAAMTGGMPSTAAVAASQQTGDLYAAKMADVLPQLYQQAYAMYQDEGNAMRQNVDMLRGLDSDAYQRYLDDVAQFNTDRAFNYNALRSQIQDAQYGEEQAYNRYLNELQQYNTDRNFNYSALRDQISDAYANDATQYQRYLDERENARYEDETAYNRALASEERDYQRMLDALSNQATLAQLGGQIGDYSGYEALGFTPDAEALLRMELAGGGRTVPAGSGGNGGSRNNSTTTPKAKDDPLGWLEAYGPESEEDALFALRAQGINKDSAEYYAKQYMGHSKALETERADELDKMNTPSASRLEGNYTIPNAIMENLIAARRSGASDEQIKALLDRNQSRGDLTKSQHDALLVYFDLD